MSNIVLLDTNVVGGLLSEIDHHSQNWQFVVDKMVSLVPNGKYVVPTPVWYEIAQWHPDSFTVVKEKIENGSPGIYQYAGYTIPNGVLMDAAWFKCQVRQKANNPDTHAAGKIKDRISIVDALIASYCLKYGYFVLTVNIQDFPEKFFEVIQISNAPSTTEYQRDLIALLKPRQDQWRESRLSGDIPIVT